MQPNRRRLGLLVFVIALLEIIGWFATSGAGQSITVPNTFVNGTVADATQVNANFTALAANALNRNVGTMLGTLNSRDVIPTSDNTYDLGSATFAFRDLYVKRNTILNAQTYSWPSAHGASGTTLTENGSGTLTWGTSGSVGRCDLRLTLTSGLAVTIADVTAATSVYVTPTPGAQCGFYDGSAAWAILNNIAEVTVAVPATTNTMYDVFCFNNSGTMACDAALAWTNDTTRATALATVSAVYVKSGTTTRRYIASFRTTGVSGQTEDSVLKRYVWSYYNRVRRHLLRQESTANWNYNSATPRQTNAAAANQVEFVVGVNEVEVEAMTQVGAFNATVGTSFVSGVGLDSTSAFHGEPGGAQVSGANQVQQVTGRYKAFPGVGRHFLSWNEVVSVAAGNTTFVSNTGVTGSTSGISAWLEN